MLRFFWILENSCIHSFSCQDMVYVVALGGNYLLNIGPMADGMIAPVFEERLRGLGAWLDVNGEAIYGSSPWRLQTENASVTVW